MGKLKLFSQSMLVALMVSTPVFAQNNIGEQAHSTLINNQGHEIGKAIYTQANKGVLVNITLKGLPTGKHGMHFHNTGSCADQTQFKMAKGHIMPTNKPHGYLHPKGPHEGNLPNLIVHNDGTAKVEIYTELVSLKGQKGKPALLDKDGSTLIIHQHPDDHKTQPIGGAGARIACGVIQAVTSQDKD